LNIRYLPTTPLEFASPFGKRLDADNRQPRVSEPLQHSTTAGRAGTAPSCSRRQDGARDRPTYFDGNKKEQFQRARAVVLCCNGSETPRLLLLSASSRFPNGLAKLERRCRQYLMFNGYSSSSGVFERPLNEYKSVTATRVLYDFYESEPSGGSTAAARRTRAPSPTDDLRLGGLPHDAPSWGAGYKRILRDYYTRTMNVDGHSTSLPLETNASRSIPT